MKLASLLEERLIIISQEVSPVGESLQEILRLMITTDNSESEIEIFMNKLKSQIGRGGLSVGEKVSLFHLAIPEMEDSRLAVKSMGGKDGVLIFFLSTPRISPKYYIQVAAAIRTMAVDKDFLLKVKSKTTSNEFFETINSRDIILNPRIEVKDVMRKDIPSVESEEKLDAIVESMVFKGMGGIVVTDADKKVLGVVTESDLVRIFLPEMMTTLGESDLMSNDPGQQVDIGERYTVKDFMTRSVMCIPEDTPITEVATLMINKKVKRLPVVKEGVLVGSVSLQEIIHEILRGWFV
jgi:predicted transcriptional regulator